MTLLKNPVKIPVSFFPAKHGGKYHAVDTVSESALCDFLCAVDIHMRSVVTVSVGDVHIHPIICKRCLKRTVYRDSTRGLRS